MTNETNTDQESRLAVGKASTVPSDDAIDLIGLLRLLIKSWKLIFMVTFLVTAFAVIYALQATEIFKAEILLSPVQEKKSTTSAFGQFGGLASLAGVSIPADSNKEQVLATLKSRKFITRFIAEKDLKPHLFADRWDVANKKWLAKDGITDEPSNGAAFHAFSKAMSFTKDNKTSFQTGLFKLSISWTNASTAADWANHLVDRLNEEMRNEAIEDSQKRIGYLKKELAKTTIQERRSVLFSLLESEEQKAMLANVNDEFALKVIDPAVAPEVRERPNRKLIVMLGGVAGLFLAVLLVFLVDFLKKLSVAASREVTGESST